MRDLHKQVGIAAFVLVPALVVVGIILAPTIYHQVWSGAHFGPPQVRDGADAGAAAAREYPAAADQRRACCSRCSSAIGLERADDAIRGLHKRMMIPGDGGSARRGDRPDGVAADHAAGQPDGRAICMLSRWLRRCWCGTWSATAGCTRPIWCGCRSILPVLLTDVPAVGHAVVACDGAGDHGGLSCFPGSNDQRSRAALRAAARR